MGKLCDEEKCPLYFYPIENVSEEIQMDFNNHFHNIASSAGSNNLSISGNMGMAMGPGVSISGATYGSYIPSAFSPVGQSIMTVDNAIRNNGCIKFKSKYFEEGIPLECLMCSKLKKIDVSIEARIIEATDALQGK